MRSGSGRVHHEFENYGLKSLALVLQSDGRRERRHQVALAFHLSRVRQHSEHRLKGFAACDLCPDLIRECFRTGVLAQDGRELPARSEQVAHQRGVVLIVVGGFLSINAVVRRTGPEDNGESFLSTSAH